MEKSLRFVYKINIYSIVQVPGNTPGGRSFQQNSGIPGSARIVCNKTIYLEPGKLILILPNTPSDTISPEIFVFDIT